MKQARTIRIAMVLFIVGVLAGVLYFTPRLAPATAKSYTLVFKDNALASGPTLMTVNQGDTVTLRMKSDREGHFMIHGYQKELMVGQNGDASLTFVADQSGLFTIHLHQGYDHIEIARLEVRPR
jgi:plastocyanin